MEQLHQSRERNTDLHLHTFKSIKTWRVNWSIIRLGSDRGKIGEWLWSEYERGQREWSWSAYERGQRVAIASKRILWHSVRLIWNSVDLRRKYTRRTQDGWKRPIQCPRPILCPYLPSSEHTKFAQFWVVSVRKCMVKKYLISYRFSFSDRFFSAMFW